MSKMTQFGIHNILFLYQEGDSQGAVSWKLSILQHSVQVEDKFTTGEQYVKLSKKKKKNPPDTAPRDAFSPSWSIHDPLSSMKFHQKWFQWKGGCQDMAITTHKSFECPSGRLLSYSWRPLYESLSKRVQDVLKNKVCWNCTNSFLPYI